MPRPSRAGRVIVNTAVTPIHYPPTPATDLDDERAQVPFLADEMIRLSSTCGDLAAIAEADELGIAGRQPSPSLAIHDQR